MLISATDIINASWKLYYQNWKKFLVYLVLLFLPTLILTLLGAISLYVDYFKPSVASNVITSLILLAVFVASIIFSVWISIAFTKAVKLALDGQPLPAWEALVNDSSRYIWPTIYTSLLTTIIIAVGALLLFVPGLIFFVWYIFVFYLIIFENKNGWEALRASKALVSGRWWAIFWRVVAPSIFFGIVSGVIAYVINWPIGHFIGSAFISELLTRSVGTIISVAFTPLVTAAIILLYHSAKTTPVNAEPTLPQN